MRDADLDISGLFAGSQLLRQLLHRRLAGDQLAHDEVQQRCPTVGALHICQLQECVQFETWRHHMQHPGNQADISRKTGDRMPQEAPQPLTPYC